jgi:signal transduction histidine kinase
MAFSRLQSLDHKATDVVALIESLRDLLTRTLGVQIILETILSRDSWQSITDGNQLESAVLNLAINARDAMPECGRLTIELANVTLTERDTRRTDGGDGGHYVRISVMTPARA